MEISLSRIPMVSGLVLERMGMKKAVQRTMLRLSGIRLSGTSFSILGRQYQDKVLQEFLRHANSRITLDPYAQAGMPNKRLAQSKLVRMVLNKGEALP